MVKRNKNGLGIEEEIYVKINFSYKRNDKQIIRNLFVTDKTQVYPKLIRNFSACYQYITQLRSFD